MAINGRRFDCSGIHWQEGIIVTSDESIKQARETTATLPNGETLPVTLLGRDRSTDVAVFKIEASIPVAPIDSECELKVGQIALAVGRNKERGLFASQGIISIVGGSWRSSLGGEYPTRFIRLDLNFYPGSGGSASVNAAGQVVGFNTTGPRRSVLTIPAATVNRVVEQLLSTGHMRRGYLGLAMQPVNLPDSSVTELSLTHQQGLMVMNVESRVSSTTSRYFARNILTEIEDTPVVRLRDIQTYLEPQNVGKAIAIQLIRAGAVQNISLTVGDRGDKGDD